MNKVVLMGRLTRDPDIRYTQGENSMCIARYTLAVDRRHKQQNAEQTADFISCVAFGRAGEFAEKYLRKGTKITIAGRIQTGSYTNKDGQRVYTTDVVIEEQEFAESKGSGQNNGQNNGQQQNNGYTGQNEGHSGQQNGYYSQGTMDGFMNIPDGIDEELPFT